ncbi:hypothetical protein NE865_11883 [Phthorimaea operculella]|nr:hypothetical protein NE865_11883 [Phthorimaea operculella]
MPPKAKPAPSFFKKNALSAVRPPRPAISQSSLLLVPEDAVEGHQERLYRCVEWTLGGSAIRHHQRKCLTKDIPPLSFTEALSKKISESILNAFLDENSTLTLQQHWDVTLPLALWDSENGSAEEKNCFKNRNNIIDDLVPLIKLAVKETDREILRQGLRNALVLRVTNSYMTYLDAGLMKFKNLTTLVLCGNYIDQLDCDQLPKGLRVLELQANRVSSLDSFVNLPPHMHYVGLSKNILTEDNMQGISQFPRSLIVLDLSDNDIYHLEPLLDLLVRLPNLSSLLLAGNPCSVCTAYATTVCSRLQRLRWLDNRQVLATDRKTSFEPHPDDLKSAYFTFTIFRIMSAPMPPRPEKGASGLFHIELELPLLDSTRRMYLMFSEFETLTDTLPPAEDDFLSHTSGVGGSKPPSKTTFEDVDMEALSDENDIFGKLVPKTSRVIKHYTTFQSNKVPWSKIMTFIEPTVRLFCPDLTALRDTFRSTITLKLVYSLLVQTGKKSPPIKASKGKSAGNIAKSPPIEMVTTIATMKCSLRNPNWSQPSQHFHWDDSLATNEAIHWGDGDLTAVNYLLQKTAQQPTAKGKQRDDTESIHKGKHNVPDNLTIHVGFAIETMRPPVMPKPTTPSPVDSKKKPRKV